MSKGSTPRPVDQQKYRDNFDRIFRRPLGHMEHKDCGWPFCDCKKECEKVKDDRNTKL